jgi:acyl-CoA thioester hydrolase
MTGTNGAKAVLSASACVEVAFHDVDAMNVCWHGHYLKYFEFGRAALLRKFDYDYRQMEASGYVWPVVEAHLKYVRPAIYGQQLEVCAQLLEYENRLKIGYEIFDCESRARLTKGYTIQLAVKAATREMQFVSPPVVFEKLERVWAA